MKEDHRILKDKRPHIHHTATPSDAEPKQSKWPLMISLVIIGALIACYFLWPAFQHFVKQAFQVLTSNDNKRISAWVAQFGFWGPVLVILAMIVQMFLFVIPATLVMVVSILAYGPVGGAALTITAVLVASTIGYAIGAYLGPLTVSKLIGDSTEKKIERYVQDYGIWAVIIARISPLLSNDATSFVSGLLRMGYWRFIGATFAGILPLTIAMAYLGENVQRLKTGFIWISAISIVAFILYILYDRRKKKRRK